MDEKEIFGKREVAQRWAKDIRNDIENSDLVDDDFIEEITELSYALLDEFESKLSKWHIIIIRFAIKIIINILKNKL